MKKILGTIGLIILYIAILVVLFNGVARFWFSGILFSPEAGFKNLNLLSVVAFILILLIYALIFKIRGKNLFKTFNLSVMTPKGFLLSLITGIFMGLFTSSLCNTSYVVNNVRRLEEYLSGIENGSTSFVVVILAMTAVLALEEMIFRGTIFNEIRSTVSLTKAIIISTLVYSLFNVIMMGYLVGVYAFVAVIFYTLAYVYLRSLLAPIILQVASLYVILGFRRTGVWKQIGNLGDVALIISIIVVTLSIVGFTYLMYVDYKKTNSQKQAAVSA